MKKIVLLFLGFFVLQNVSGQCPATATISNCSCCVTLTWSPGLTTYPSTIVFALGSLLFPSTFLFAQNVSINSNGELPDPKAILDLSSTTSGLFIPRMTTVQHHAIATPPIGLQVFNLSTNTLDIYRSTEWASVAFTTTEQNAIFFLTILTNTP